MSSMVIINDAGLKTHHLCPACIIDYTKGLEPCDEVVPTFYSERHARDSGWRKTDDLMFCDPDKPYAWVCPDCWPGDAQRGHE